MKNLFILSIMLVIIACSPSSTNQYETINKARWSTTTIEVHWKNSTEINDICRTLGANDGSGGNFRACARSKPENLAICEIYATQPSNFDDEETLSILGHEVWHCLGARHK